MNRFNQKTAIFYIITIVFVLILFNLITTYGKTNLKAPPSIAGSYKVEFEPQANCPNSEKILLIIQQSGIYLNAILLSSDSGKALVEYPKYFPLSGQWQKQELKLAGTIDNLDICTSPPLKTANSKPKNLTYNIRIQGKFAGSNLRGKIALNSQAEGFDFTAQRQSFDLESE